MDNSIYGNYICAYMMLTSSLTTGLDPKYSNKSRDQWLLLTTVQTILTLSNRCIQCIQ